MIDLLVWIVFGLIVGAISRAIVPAARMGCLGTMILGVLGSLVGGTLGVLIQTGQVAGLHAGGFISSILGAILLLLLFRR